MQSGLLLNHQVQLYSVSSLDQVLVSRELDLVRSTKIGWSADEELSRPRKLSGNPYPSLEVKSAGQPRGEYKDQYDDYVCRKLVLLLDLVSSSSSSACSVRLSVCAFRPSHRQWTDSGRIHKQLQTPNIDQTNNQRCLAKYSVLLPS